MKKCKYGTRDENGKRSLLYLPSLDTGPLSAGIIGNKEFNGRNFKWYEDPTPERYQHKAFLISAGTRYKKFDYASQMGFPDDMFVFGDSGGYQIATGVLTWSDNLRTDIFNWLENNATIAANLDLPPRTKMEGKFDECLRISNENFKYFSENQSGKVEYLTCLQGSQLDKYKYWYDRVKGYDFNGWAIGEPKGSYGILSSLAVLLDGKEHLDPNCKTIHFLGVTSVHEIILLAYIQKKFNEMGLDILITTDSSSPGRATAFGFYYLGFELKTESFRMIRVPRKKDNDIYKTDWKMVMVNDYDRYLFQDGWMDVERYNSLDYGVMVLHNLGIYLDAFEYIKGVINMDSYFYDKLLAKDTQRIIASIDEIMESSKPMETFRKNQKLYSGVKERINPIKHNFFTDV